MGLPGTTRVHWPAESPRVDMIRRATILIAGAGLILGLLNLDQLTGGPFLLGGILGFVIPLVVIAVTGILALSKKNCPPSPPPAGLLGATLPNWSPDSDQKAIDAISRWIESSPRSHPEVIAICHHSIPATVGDEGPPHLLEEERLVEGNITVLDTGFILSLMPLAFVLIVYFGIQRNSSSPLFVLLPLIPTLVVLIPATRFAIRGLRSRGVPRFTIGQGFILDTATRRTFHAGEVVLFVRPYWVSPVGKGRLLKVDLIGRDFRHRFLFTDPRSPEFVTLWERWCHPDPRPELALKGS